MSLRPFLAAIAFALALAAPLQAQPRGEATPAAPPVAVTSVEGITEYRLANGLQLLLFPDGSKPSTTVNLTLHTGSRHENYGETGMAHLLEHMLFKGTATTRNIWNEFTKRGLRANGSTSFDRTNYFASWSASDENLRWYLGWLADAMVNSTILKSDLDPEMTVVRNEMEGGENNPQRILVQQMLASMYQWHNYGKSVIGARSDIEQVDIARLQAFYRRHYQPDNATLIVSGTFDSAEVLRLVTRHFAPIPRPSRALERTLTLDPAQDGERSVTLRRVGGNAQVYAAFHIPPAAHPDFAAAQMLAHVLGNTPSGRLHKRLVERQLASSSFGFAWGLAEPGPLFFGVSLAPGQDADRARAELLATLESVAAEPVTDEELQRARTQWLNGFERGFANPEVVGVALSEAIAQGDWRLAFMGRDAVRRVSLADVNRVAGERLRRDNRTVGTYLPTAQPERAPAPATVDVAARVKGYQGDKGSAAVEAFDPTPANIDARTKRTALASGMQLALLAKASRGNEVRAQLRLPYGDLESLRGAGLVPALLAGMFDKGGAGLTRQQIADRFTQLNAEVGFGSGEQAIAVSISTKRDRLPEVIALVGRLLREPALPAEQLEEMRRAQRAGIQRARSEPGALIANRLDRHGNPYAADDWRYARSFDETEQALNGATVEQLRRFHRRFVAAGAGQFAAVGDFDAAAVESALAAAFGDWRDPADGRLPYRRVPRPFVAPAAERFELHTPDKPNAEFRLYQPVAVREPDGDYAALTVGNAIFSAGGGSRLWDRMREREGLSYGVGSGIQWSSHEPHSRYIVGGQFAPANRGKMEVALREEIARLLKDGFTQTELDQRRNGILQQRRLARAQDGALAGALLNNLVLGRTYAVSQQVDEAIERLTLEQLNAAWRRHIDPSKWAVAWGGDFKP
jgi:zinc protease